MKNINKLWILLIAICLSITLQAQDEDNKIKIKIKKEVNGEMTTIEKSYKTVEEMKKDPDLQHLNIKLMDGGSFFFSDDVNGKFDVTIDKSEDGEIRKNQFFFKVDKDEDFEWKEENHEIEVTKDEDGNVTILRNGQPLDKGGNVTIHKFNSDDVESIDHIKVHKGDDGHKVIIINGDREIKLDGMGGDEMQEKVEVIVNSLKDLKDGDSKNMSTVTISIRKTKIQIEDIVESDASLKQLNLDNKRQLKLNDLVYYPNPTEGKFNLSFQGKSIPTEVTITDLSGKTVFRDVVSDFSGQYDNDIDLNNEAKGIYIMQIIQGNKALNKKIIIE